MKFDEAFKAMRENGAAIRRPHWKGVRFLFYQHGRTYAHYRSGHTGIFMLWEGSCIGDDWQVVEAESIPVRPVPKSRVIPKNPKGFADGLELKQAEARKRWRKSSSTVSHRREA